MVHLQHILCIVWASLHIRMVNVIHIEEGTKETRERKQREEPFLSLFYILRRVGGGLGWPGCSVVVLLLPHPPKSWRGSSHLAMVPTQLKQKWNQ